MLPIIGNTAVRTAFVSTNSITQGEQVAGVWQPLYDRFGIHIDFAHRTFRWDSESNQKAHVHCVIVGFSAAENSKARYLYSGENVKEAENINPYLLDAPLVFIQSQKLSIADVPPMKTGNRPADGGHLIIEAGDYAEFIAKEPQAVKYIKKFMSAREFINGLDRYCLWLVGASPAEIRKMPLVRQRVEACRQDRLDAPDKGRQKLADTPTLFRETMNPKTSVVIPEVSSERRRYIPMDFLDENTIVSNKIQVIPDVTLYHFGVLNSNVHMAWVRAVCDRLKSDYDYSKKIVYNNFPWPLSASLSQGGGQGSEQAAALRADIEKTAQGILDARALYPDCSLADLYDESTMPPELRRAHQANDRAVMKAYGFPVKHFNESDCVVALMKLYQQLAEK